ncbi:hypothetical protein MTO96_032664 [Rhipicephalus appendiculatus]
MSQVDKKQTKANITNATLGTPLPQQTKKASRSLSSGVSPPSLSSPLLSAPEPENTRKSGGKKQRSQHLSRASPSPIADRRHPSPSSGAETPGQLTPISRPQTPPPVTLRYGRSSATSSIQPQPAFATPHEITASPNGKLDVQKQPRMQEKGEQVPYAPNGEDTVGTLHVKKQGMSQQASLKAMNTLLVEHATPASQANTDSAARTRGPIAYKGNRRLHCAVLLAVGLCVGLVVLFAYLRPKPFRGVVELCKTDSCYAYR